MLYPMGRKRNNQVFSRWEQILITLSDKAFFTVVRNYLGDIKTPFNKHDLISRMVSFFLKAEIMETIALSIDSRDAELLMLVHLLPSPKEEELFQFFESERSYLDIHHHLLNLEERLLIYITQNPDEPEINETPLTEQLIREGIIGINTLFTTLPVPYKARPHPWLNDALLLALVSFFRGNRDICKGNGRISKKGYAKILNVFPQLGKETPLGRRLDLAVSLLFSSRLCRFGQSGFYCDSGAWLSLADMTGKRVWPYLWAHIVVNVLNREPDYLEICSIAETLFSILAFFPGDRGITTNTLERGVAFACIRKGLLKETQQGILHTLLALELFVPSEDQPEMLVKHPELFREEGVHRKKPLLQANFDISLPHDVSMREGLFVALAGEIRKYDQVSIYELKKESVKRYLSEGFTLEDLKNRFESLLGNMIPQNILFTLNRWQQEYDSVRVYQGTVIKVTGEAEHLVEHSPGIRQWLVAKLAPGVFLFDPKEENKWRKTLEKAGVAVPDLKEAEREDPSSPNMSVLIPDFSSEATVLTGETTAELLKSGFPGLPRRLHSWEEHAKRMISIVESMAVPEADQEELKARINKRLILTEEQLKHRNTPSGTKEAKGLDYIGKIRLIEQTLDKSQDLLEVIQRTADGSPEKLLLKPEDMIKRNDELYVTGYKLPEQGMIELKVRKLNLVRKLKRSLFAP